MAQINPMNEAPLHYWRARDYQVHDLVSMCRELSETRLLGAAHFLEGKLLDFNVSQCIVDKKEGHALAWFKYFKDVVDNWQGAPLLGTVGVWADDAVWPFTRSFTERAPFIAFGRTQPDTTTILVPDPVFMGSDGYTHERSKIECIDDLIPFEKKKNAAIWRGANSDLGSGRTPGVYGPRIQLCLQSKGLDDSDVLDAGLSVVNDYGNPDYKRDIKSLDIEKGFVDFYQFFEHRLQLEIDGMHCTWISCFGKLYSKSCLLKVESQNEQWFYHKLIPWKHYVPISADLENLEERIRWCQEHVQLCKDIGEASHDLMKSISYEESLDETGAMLAELFKAQRS